MRGHTVNIPFGFGIQGWEFARGLGLEGWNGACARWGLRVEGYRFESGEGGGVSGQGKTLVPCRKVVSCYSPLSVSFPRLLLFIPLFFADENVGDVLQRCRRKFEDADVYLFFFT
ncbi:hypothetical protein NPIL_483941 [Nephila pilipes]|uniref:Uncharacterized protein n=1 Tax=Nephila pilipes TaxID=299642 RepID=A0A8X6PZW8_NEPPI|nr:hypothetical protein NPIL_483941 [Nephila pilipes]